MEPTSQSRFVPAPSYQAADRTTIFQNFSAIVQGSPAPFPPSVVEHTRQLDQQRRVHSYPIIHENFHDVNMPIVTEQCPMTYDSTNMRIEVAEGKTMGISDLTLSFPWLFTFCCFAIFLTPIWQTLHLANDQNVLYWVGPFGNIVAGIPLLFVFGHIVHAMKGKAHSGMILICLLLPSFVLVFVADMVLSKVSAQSDMLFSTDCDTCAGKRELDRARVAAELLFRTCLEDTVGLPPAQMRNLTIAQARQMYRVQDCEEYPLALIKHRKTWTYLRYLEDTHNCAGWCDFTAPLWTHREVQDSCSVAVSTIFEGKIKHMSSQVMMYSVLLLGIISFTLILVNRVVNAATMQLATIGSTPSMRHL